MNKAGKTVGPWATDYAAMGCKTAVLRALKFAPLESERLNAAIKAEEDTVFADRVAASAVEQRPSVAERVAERIGVALRFVHRPIEDVNEEMRLYRTYLVVQSILLGGPAYVPTLYIADYEAAGKQLDLAVDMHTLKEETWNREPDFVIRGLGVFEELPE